VTLDYVGRIDGRAFDGGQGNDIALILGDGRFLVDFENHLKGLKTDADATFEIHFPEDYHGKELAAKTATFEVKLKRIEEATLPPMDAEFARSLGIKDGNVAQMREEIRTNLEHEIKQRAALRLRDQVMQEFLDRTEVTAPKSLVELEIEHLQTTARRDLEVRDVKTEGIALPREIFEAQAQRRVKLGMILAEVVKTHGLQPQADQIRALAEERAQSYEQPEQVVQWIYQSPQRLRELESAAAENNVVQWALRTAEVEETTLPFDELMGSRK
jgi:trigger factor